MDGNMAARGSARNLAAARELADSRDLLDGLPIDADEAADLLRRYAEFRSQLSAGQKQVVDTAETAARTQALVGSQFDELALVSAAVDVESEQNGGGSWVSGIILTIRIRC